MKNGSFNPPYSVAVMVIYRVFFSCLATTEVAKGKEFDRTV